MTTVSRRAGTLERARADILRHWRTIHDHAVAAGEHDVAQVVREATDHAGKALPYAISGRVCHSVFASSRSLTPLTYEPEQVPYPFGIAMLDIPFRLAELDMNCVGIQWGTTLNGVWIVPLTDAKVLGMSPPLSPFPVTTGYLLPAAKKVDSADDSRHTSALAIALWHTIPKSDCILVGPGEGSAVVVNHSTRRR